MSATETSVAHLLYGLLERAPDADGPQSLETFVKQGAATGGTPDAIQTMQDVVGAMLTSPEYAALHSTLTHAQFVDEVYEGPMSPHAETRGV